jgi:hypothetical protein
MMSSWFQTKLDRGIIAPMKPRVMLLAVFTAFVGLMTAPGHLDPLLGATAILAIVAGAGAAGVLNVWYDAQIDTVMTRTAWRPIPRGTVSRIEALARRVLASLPHLRTSATPRWSFHRCMNPSVSVCMKLTSAFSSSSERPIRPMNLVFMLAVDSGAGQHVMPSPGSFPPQRGRTSRVL